MSKSKKVDYDVIIIGAGIGGLATAALLAKQGFKVIVIEQNEGPGGRCGGILKDGYLFDIGASMFWGFEKGGAFNSLFHRLGLFDDIFEKDSLRKLDPAFQVVMPNHRINIYSKRNMLYRELKREFPAIVCNLEDFYSEIDSIDEKIYENYNNIHPYSFNISKKKHRNAGKLSGKLSMLAAYGSSKKLLKNIDLEMERFLDIQTMYFGQNTAINSSLLFLTTILGIPGRGIYYIKGGSRTIANTLADLVKRHGGEITYNSTVKEILIKRRSSRGVRATYEAVTVDILARCVVCASPVFTLGSLIKAKRARKIYDKFLKSMYQKYVPFTVLLGVDGKVIPEPMKEHVFMMRDYNLPPGDDNFIFLSVNPAWDKMRAPKGKRAITASIFLKRESLEGIQMEDFAKRKTDNIISYLEQVMPFLSSYIDLTITIDPMTYQKLTMQDKGCIGMIEGGKVNVYGFQGASNIMPFNRLLLAGDSTYPGHGTVCAVRSGLEAVKLISG